MNHEISRSVCVSLITCLLALLIAGNSIVWRLIYFLLAFTALVSGCAISLFLVVFLIDNTKVYQHNQIEETEEQKYLFRRLRLLLLYLKNKLTKSETVKFFEKQVKAQQFTIYEKIHKLGLTDTSCYMKTAHDKNKYSEEVCMSKELTQLLYRLFDYSYRDFVEVW